MTSLFDGVEVIHFANSEQIQGVKEFLSPEAFELLWLTRDTNLDEFDLNDFA